MMTYYVQEPVTRYDKRRNVYAKPIEIAAGFFVVRHPGARELRAVPEKLSTPSGNDETAMLILRREGDTFWCVGVAGRDYRSRVKYLASRRWELVSATEQGAEWTVDGWMWRSAMQWRPVEA
jgi:hypothetical protein